MKLLQTLSFICLSMLLLISCGKKNEAGKFIPGNASVVVVIDGASINKKLSWEEIKQGELFKQAYADSTMSAMAKSAMDNPENTGISINDDMSFFMVNDSSGTYGALTGKVKDATKFKNYLKATLKEGVASEKGKIQFMTQKDYTISWNDERFYMVGEINTSGMNPLAQMPSMDNYDSSTASKNLDVVSIAEKLYSIKEKNSLAENEKFGEVMKKEGDVRFWVSVDALQSQSMGMAAMAMMNVSKLTKDSYYTGVANFEDGKIVMDIVSYSGKELTELWKKYQGDDVDTKMIEQSPVKDPAFVVAMNYKPKGLKALLELTGMEGFANLGVSRLGFTMDDFINGHDGKLLFVGGDASRDSLGSQDMKGFFTVGINDKVAFAKLINAAKKEAGMIPSDKAQYVVNDKYFVLGTPGIAASYLDGKAKSNYNFLDKIKGGPMGGFINLDYIMKNMASTASYRSAQDSINIAMWDNASFNGGNFENGGVTQHIEINMKDKKTNSLKQLNQYVNKMAIEDKKRRESYTNDIIVEEAIKDTLVPMIVN